MPGENVKLKKQENSHASDYTRFLMKDETNFLVSLFYMI